LKETARKFLEKGEQSIAAAEHLLLDDYAEFAASRAYYAMFYIAEALLSERGKRFRKHSGVHSAFGEHFAKTGVLDPKFHRWLLDAYDKRIKSDYDVDEVLVRGDAETLIQQADEFLAEARKLLSG
jgi:uncharacterized protein (UPF0332 family)